MTTDETPAMTVREAGRRGGHATHAKYGPEFARAAGVKGGTATKTKYGVEHFKKMGRILGERNKEVHADDTYFHDLAVKAGQAMKAKYGREYYAKIGKLSAERRWARKRETATTAATSSSPAE